MRLLPLLLLVACAAPPPPAPVDDDPAKSCQRDFCPSAPLHNVDFGAIIINGLPACRCVCDFAKSRAMVFTPWVWTEEQMAEERRRWSVFCPAPVPRP